VFEREINWSNYESERMIDRKDLGLLLDYDHQKEAEQNDKLNEVMKTTSNKYIKYQHQNKNKQQINHFYFNFILFIYLFFFFIFIFMLATCPICLHVCQSINKYCIKRYS
jgi:hypothetical protein